MLQSISLRNFKIFAAKTTFSFSKINLLTGINGRGKSSLLQSLLLFKQSIADNENTSRIILNGNAVQLGKFSDLKNIDNTNRDTIDISFGFKDENTNLTLDVAYKFIENEIDDVVLDIQSCHIQSNHNFVNRQSEINAKDIAIVYDTEKAQCMEAWTDNQPFKSASNTLTRFAFLPISELNERVDAYFSLKRIHYISPDRLGPQNFYYKSQLPDFLSLDKQGHNLATIAAKQRLERVNFDLCITMPIYQNVQMLNNATTLETQIGNWIGYITDTHNVGIHLDSTSNDYIITLQFIFGDKKFKPANIGFGYSYILPIIISALIAKPNDILIVENPEAHLHPKAQSRLAKFLANVASTGVQLFIESHSEHILNALRVVVKKAELAPEDIRIHYFSTDGIHTPIIDEDGRIDEWPDGFFDEWNLNLMELM